MPGDMDRNLDPAVGQARIASSHRYHNHKYWQSSTQCSTKYLQIAFGSPGAYAPGSPPAMEGGLTTTTSSHRNWTTDGGHVKIAGSGPDRPSRPSRRKSDRQACVMSGATDQGRALTAVLILTRLNGPHWVCHLQARSSRRPHGPLHPSRGAPPLPGR